MKRFLLFLALLFLVPGAARAQTICQNAATGPQLYSKTGTGVPQFVPGALNEALGYIPQAYVALPGMPSSPLAFCGPTWTANYTYAVGNLIEPVPGGDVWQAVGCEIDCESGSTQPSLFSGTPFSTIFWPSPVLAWVSTCSDPSSTATCTTVDAAGTSEPINIGEPSPGADVGATMVISAYSTSTYDGAWKVDASTETSPYTFSFAASGLGSGSCASGTTSCVVYQRGTQVTDNHVLWQDVGPQNEMTLLTPTVTVTPASSTITTMQALSVTVVVSGGGSNPTPTGSVVLTSGSYSSGGTTLNDGSATINIPAGSLAVGTDTLTATYSGNGNYSPASGTASVTVTPAGLTPTVTVTPSSPTITTAQALNVTVAVSGGDSNPTPSGSVILTSGNFSSGSITLNNGDATINIPAGSLAVGTDTLTANYSGDSNYSPGSGTASVTVTQAVFTATVTVTPSSSAITTAQALNVAVAVSGGDSNPTPTGSVTLTSGSYSSASTTLNDGSATINIPACSLAVGTDTLAVNYSGDSNYSPATGAASVSVTLAPCFNVIGVPASISINPGATTGNTSTITVTSVDGFSGNVTLTAAITSSPAGAQHLPTFSFSPSSSVNVTPGTAGTATLTISTTAASGATLAYPARPSARWYIAGVTSIIIFALALSLLLEIGIGLPAWRRSGRTRIGMFVLSVVFISGLFACGSSGSSGKGNSGTTPGSYTVTVTGTSGTITASSTVTLTVQ